ncbi:hypothetical protein OK348_06835 [Flavobacterium sp. MXW15]|uniref:Uncharacterized protein n=1 Tax=Xanthomonas chitinilytica TaxID=2989819 RepID=A0ABT3JTD5_9XANT|nr:hypothetical protein [Xanthomonas sp. H13-6]MCW4454508.1 hypothetical protein [Flavobacterium sp. MXW15]MCW4471747.1 hypothetical protein [Xanthomonas sp. H13-6]
MPFVNEYIPPEDEEKYRLAEIDAKFNGGNRTRQWTIDRERDIYFRNLSRGREEETRHQGVWTFYWKGTPLTLRLDLLGGEGKPGDPGWSHWRLVSLNGTNGLSSALEWHRQSILDDLKQTLLAYKDGGVFSVNTDYRVILELAEECIL